MKGKTTDREDKYRARFIELIPKKRIIEAIKFDTTHPEYSEEMIVDITFTPVDEGTRVTFLFKNIPEGIKLEDNEAGTNSSLEKLAQYVENKNNRPDKK